MKRIPFLLTTSLLFALFALGCTDQVEEVSEVTALRVQPVGNSTFHYSRIPGNPQSVYSAEVIEYADGSVEVIRTVIPFNSNHNYVHSVLNSTVPITQGSQGAEIDFSADDGWFVPFDPAGSVEQLNRNVVKVDCECDNGPSGCNLDVRFDPSTGDADIGCLANQDCTQNCVANLTFGSQNLTHDGGILIGANEVRTP